ncbi:hypothetical protein TI04_11055, partial [Achromatium sp. WMS2]
MVMGCVGLGQQSMNSTMITYFLSNDLRQKWSVVILYKLNQWIMLNNYAYAYWLSMYQSRA